MNPGGTPSPLDLSKATKLKCVEFQLGKAWVRWISETLRSARVNTVRQINLTLYATFHVTEDVVREWLDLDHLLVQLWTSHLIVPKVTYGPELGVLTSNLVPELMNRGAVHVMEHNG